MGAGSVDERAVAVEDERGKGFIEREAENSHAPILALPDWGGHGRRGLGGTVVFPIRAGVGKPCISNARCGAARIGYAATSVSSMAAELRTASTPRVWAGVKAFATSSSPGSR